MIPELVRQAFTFKRLEGDPLCSGVIQPTPELCLTEHTTLAPSGEGAWDVLEAADRFPSGLIRQYTVSQTSNIGFQIHLPSLLTCEGQCLEPPKRLQCGVP